MTNNSKNLTLKQWLEQARKVLQPSNSALLDAELLASFVLQKPRTWLHAHNEYQLTKLEQDQLNNLLQRRIDQEPIAYIIGEKEFYGRDFVISPEVLIPRPASEDLIEMVLALPDKQASFIDVGTGSGALGLTVALEKPGWHGVLTDISGEALNVAKQNSQKLGATNIVFREQNLLDEDEALYNIIIANLPYVPESMMNKPDLAHEPKIALFAANNGLKLYEKLFQQLAARQQKPQHLFTESLPEQHSALEAFARDAGYSLTETKGLIQRFTLPG